MKTRNLTIAAFTEEPSMLGRRDRGPCRTKREHEFHQEC